MRLMDVVTLMFILAMLVFFWYSGGDNIVLTWWDTVVFQYTQPGGM